MTLRVKIPDEIVSRLLQIAGKPFEERLRFWARFFLNYPYLDAPLGEGNEYPRLRLDGFDCMTYVETCLALALSESQNQVPQNIDRIRYRHGIPAFSNRNHFVSIDWLPNNDWLLIPRDDLADSVLERSIDRAAFFEEKGHVFTHNEGLPAIGRVSSKYISVEKFENIPAQELDSSVIMFVGRLDWLVVSHMGMLFSSGHDIELYHASSILRKAVRLPLLQYFTVNPKLKGAIIAEIIA